MQSKLRGLTAYDRHKLLINEYYMSYPGASANIPRRDPTRDKRDIDVIKENHQFLWEEDDVVDTWGKQLAKKYHDKLFKEYCICDLSRYKENKVGLRWRIEKEVVSGKGQFNCGEQKCNEMDHLRTWEVNFAYMEHGFKKSSLVKIRLCGECSRRLNYHHQKKEVTKKKKKKSKKTKKDRGDKHRESPKEDEPSTSTTTTTEAAESSKTEEPSSSSTDVWKESQQTAEEKSRDEEFEEYLEDLFL
nr:EOG090X0H59 [Chydorus sphaericus]